MRSLQSVEPFSSLAVAIAMAVAITFGWPAIGLSQDELTFEPYSVFVAEEESFAYCGPSEDYYRTDPLRYGQTLDVYAETDDGWLGIRPPEDSFCWVPADAIEVEPAEEAGTVVEDRTVAWIGTHLGRARQYRWQVQLAKGEPVTVIGRSEREGPDGPQLWYRIVPPSGEYRWVHRDSIVMSSEELVESVRKRSNQNPAPIAVDDSVARSAVAESTRLTAPSDESNESTVDSHQLRADSDASVASGPSVLHRDQAIGSGLNKQWRNQEDATVAEQTQAAADRPQSALDAFKQGGLLASIEFMSRPRIQEIGSQPQTAPSVEQPTDSLWVAGASRVPNHSSMANQTGSAVNSGLGLPNSLQPAPQPSQIAQVSGQFPAAGQSPSSFVTTAAHSFNVVPAERIAQIEAEVNDTDVDRLNLILSRLMAGQASAAETEPVERAAARLAATAPDSVTAGRARMVAETVQRYRRVATLRDGQSVIQTNVTVPSAATPIDFSGRSEMTTPSLSAAPVPTLGPTIGPSSTPVQTATDHGNGVIEQAGFLMQVYSARSNSPPFALTDHAGRTVAYVTPAPGVNLRTHLNSHIIVVGSRGYLTGLNMPHVMATQAVRSPE